MSARFLGVLCGSVRSWLTSFVHTGHHVAGQMAKLQLFGSYVALVTPFTDSDEV